MYTRIGTGRNKPPQPPNPLLGPSSAAQRAASGTCRDIFEIALNERRSLRPLEAGGAYKLRECRDNFRHEVEVVGSIAEFLRTRPGYGRHGILVGCTEDDKAHRLKRVPLIIARELGSNLIPAVKALTLEGVPVADIDTFIRSIKPQVDHLLADCDAVRAATSGSIQSEYAALKAGTSGTARMCAEALHIAEQAVSFCGRYE